MAGASDKARFYLEQAVPQLQEFKEKKIFDEVSWKMPRDEHHASVELFLTKNPRMRSETLSRRDPTLNIRCLEGGHNPSILHSMRLGKSV